MPPSPPPDQDFPYWLVLLAGTGLVLFWQVVTNDMHAQVLRTLMQGLWVTVYVTIIAFTLASALGLGLALMALSRSIVLRQMARLYVEVILVCPLKSGPP